jgi:hypothetical protein
MGGWLGLVDGWTYVLLGCSVWWANLVASLCGGDASVA